MATAILRKKNKVEGIIISAYKAILITQQGTIKTDI